MSGLTHNSRLERRLNLLLPQLLEIYVSGEEGVVLDLLGAIHAESPRRVTIEQSSEQRSSFGTALVREAKRVRKDLAVHFVGVLVVEWWETSELIISVMPSRTS